MNSLVSTMASSSRSYLMVNRGLFCLAGLDDGLLELHRLFTDLLGPLRLGACGLDLHEPHAVGDVLKHLGLTLNDRLIHLLPEHLLLLISLTNHLLVLFRLFIENAHHVLFGGWFFGVANVLVLGTEFEVFG